MSEPTVREATAAEVRAWARKQGIDVGSRGHLGAKLVRAFNGRHRRVRYFNSNPFAFENKEQSS